MAQHRKVCKIMALHRAHVTNSFATILSPTDMSHPINPSIGARVQYYVTADLEPLPSVRLFWL